MPYSFDIYPSLNMLIFRPIGIVTEANVLAYFNDVLAHPHFRTGLNRMVDNTKLVDLNVTYAEMRNIVQSEMRPDNPDDPTPKTAFVTKGSTDFGMARMYQAVSESRGPQDVALCSTVGEALDFFGIAHETFTAVTGQTVTA